MKRNSLEQVPDAAEPSGDGRLERARRLCRQFGARKPSRRKRAARRRARNRVALAASPVILRFEPTEATLTWRQRLRTIFLCGAIELAVLSGVPMRPEEIRELMQTMNQPKIVHTLPEEEETGDPP